MEGPHRRKPAGALSFGCFEGGGFRIAGVSDVRQPLAVYRLTDAYAERSKPAPNPAINATFLAAEGGGP